MCVCVCVCVCVCACACVRVYMCVCVLAGSSSERLLEGAEVAERGVLFDFNYLRMTRCTAGLYMVASLDEKKQVCVFHLSLGSCEPVTHKVGGGSPYTDFNCLRITKEPPANNKDAYFITGEKRRKKKKKKKEGKKEEYPISCQISVS